MQLPMIASELTKAYTPNRNRLKALTDAGMYYNGMNYLEQPGFDLSKALSGLSGVGGGGGSGVVGGALGGAGTGAAVGSAFGPPGALIGGAAGALIGGIGAGIEGGKADEREKEQLKLLQRSQDTQERTVGLNALKTLADMRSSAIANRRKSLFKNDLARLANGGL